MIAWKYLNKEAATIDAIRDFRNMQRIFQITPIKFKSINNTNSISHNDAEFSCELSNFQINDILLNEKYKQATEYMKWFKPSWDSLRIEEKVILEEFYMKDGKGASKRLQIKLCYSERHIARLKRNALIRLSQALYGI